MSHLDRCFGIRPWLSVVLLIGLLLAPTIAHSDTRLPVVSPRDAEMDAGRLDRIDQVVSAGLARKKMPGCVVCIGRKGHIVFRRAYGFRQLKPEKVPMTVDTVFDMASITKPVAL